MRKREKKPQTKRSKVVKTILSAVVCVILAVAMILANTLQKDNTRQVDNTMKTNLNRADNTGVDLNGCDPEYNKADYTEEELEEKELDLKRRMAEEGTVLLKNEDGALPVAADTCYSLLSANTTKLLVTDGMGKSRENLKQMFEGSGASVNETLWDFYSGQKDYGLGDGSISWGDEEDFSINECPLSELEEAGVLDSLNGTTPVYFLKRVAGEGRDMPRSMYNHTDIPEDQVRTYLEPDSAELEILKYLNDHFANTILVVNSNAAMELAWLEEFPNIRAVVYATDVRALPEILSGEVNPSGRTVDTFAADALASPAAQNFGDYQYVDASGELTDYNYISYAEGIYVGYRYYETRYEDAVLGQGNAGDYDYDTQVCYPFGYGLSYTSFAWSNLNAVWDEDVCSVTVDVRNTGDVSGKEVVEIYAQSPYTEYDRQNGVEKAAVTLVGFAKTQELAPGETQTVTVTFDKEQLKAYDAKNAKTYIFDAGQYYITAAANAHEAVNNILRAKGADASRMTGDGRADMVASYVPDNQEVDTVTYAKDSYRGAEITNRFDDVVGTVTYLSRSDWTGTFPSHDGEVSDQLSTWGNEINGTDEQGNPASFLYTKEASEELLEQLESFDSGNPTDPDSFADEEIVYGEKNGLTLIDMRGLEFDDPKWEELLDELTEEDYFTMIALSGYGTEYLDSINKPFCTDADGSSGMTLYGGTNAVYPTPITMAQTWNADLALEYGVLIGNGACVGGGDGWYAPSMNIHRTPFTGRNGEYFSEDPFLSGKMAAQEVYGAATKGVYSYIKHFAFNDQENHRGDREGQYGLATWLNEQSAREIYLLPFEMCMKSGDVEINYIAEKEDGTLESATTQIRACQAVMTAFNRIGATWTGGSYALITEILRNEWAFQGFVLTDNANTGVFMDGYQMIEAGADGKLTYLEESARFDFDPQDKAMYHYGREAMHRMLYTVANSRAMDGVAPGGKFIDDATLTENFILGVNIICPVLILLLVILTVLRFRKKSKI